MKRLFILLLSICAAPVAAQDVIIIGEIHDNPAHHTYQAEKTAEIKPRALVMEMLTPEQAALAQTGQADDQATLAEQLNWDQSGWPDFGYYYPILTAVEGMKIFGGAMTDAERRTIREGQLMAVMGEDASRYGLTTPLPASQQDARETLQFDAHCQAVPREVMGRMVDVQRLRDAMLARAVVMAMDQTGGPVVVITGNGHARRDWGIPAILAQVAPKLDIHVIGQTEDNHPLPGGFDETRSAPTIERPDPRDAFR